MNHNTLLINLAYIHAFCYSPLHHESIYVHRFFITLADVRKQLQAIVQDVLLKFSRDMRREGHSQETTEDAPPLKKAGAPELLGPLAIFSMLVGLGSWSLLN